MSYTQLVSPNLSAVGRLGWCLEYASRLVFKNPAGGTTAWNAWLVCNQHRDQNFPSGVSFPVWFSGAGGDGHVAVFTPNGIYSSPYNVSSGHAVLSSIAEVERLYGVKYVGWSDDILQELVIKKGDDMSTVGEIEFNDLFRAFFVDINLVTQDDRKRWVGAETNTVIRSMAADPRFINQPPAGVVPYSGPQLFVKQ